MWVWVGVAYTTTLSSGLCMTLSNYSPPFMAGSSCGGKSVRSPSLRALIKVLVLSRHQSRRLTLQGGVKDLQPLRIIFFRNSFSIRQLLPEDDCDEPPPAAYRTTSSDDAPILLFMLAAGAMLEQP